MKLSVSIVTLFALVSSVHVTSAFTLNDLNLFASTEPQSEGVDLTDPSSVHAHAISLAMDEKTAESLEFFEKALELAPDSAHFMNDLGVTYMRLGKLDEAEAVFLKGLEVAPDHEDLERNLDAIEGHIEHRDAQMSDKFEDFAHVEYRPGMYRDPYKPVTKKKGGVKRRRRPRAGIDADGVVEPDPQKAAELRSQAIELAMADKLSEALPLFERAVKYAPTDAFYMSDLGVTYLRLNDLDKAKEILDRANEISPGEASILDNLKALQQHLDHRDGQRMRAASNPDNNPVVEAQPFENAGIYDEDEEEE